MTLAKCHLDESSDEEGGSADNEPFLLRSQRTGWINDGEADSFDGEGHSAASGISLTEVLCHSQGIKDGDTDSANADQPQCRICLDTGGDDLIAPCQCRGSQKFVHRTCLDYWRAAKEGFAFAHCTECRALFHLRANMPPDRWWLRLKFQLLVMRDYAAIFIIVQLVVASLGLILYVFYGEELREMFGYEQHPYGFYILAVIVIAVVGLLYGFFIAIICGQKISNRHYHILAKQELTKEYVVETLHDNDDPPSLDSGHINELMMLGLY
eukprot:c24851_g1_i2 orf=873-1676(-)